MMPDKGIEFDLRALSIYEEALGELDSSIDDVYLDFANKVVRWYESHWIVSDDYSTFYPSKRFRRKDDFVIFKAFDGLFGNQQNALHRAIGADADVGKNH